MKTAESSQDALDDVLIVIPTLNEWRHLPPLLDQLLDECDDALVIVVDGGSTDGTQAIARQRGVSDRRVALLDNPKRIQSAAVNLAVARHGAGRRWLVRIDAHCSYPPGYIRGLVNTARVTGASSVVVPMITEGFSCFQRAAAAAQNSILGNGGSPHRLLGEGKFVDHGHHALMQIDKFAEVGGYCEQFTHNEDAELDLRLVQRGVRIWLEPRLAIRYFPRTSPIALFRQYYNYGKGRAKTVQRHHGRLKPRQLAPLAVLPALLVLPLSILAPWLAVPFLAWLGLSLGFGIGLGIKLRDRCALASGMAAVLMHLGWATGFALQRLMGKRPDADGRSLSIASL